MQTLKLPAACASYIQNSARHQGWGKVVNNWSTVCQRRSLVSEADKAVSLGGGSSIMPELVTGAIVTGFPQARVDHNQPERLVM